ncbi:MAG: DUF885 domain-containing protein [Hyphomonadaceae bacterium]|nr:DUF885 domain-containing protein [Hyphomonadaceae bacterium]
MIDRRHVLRAGAAMLASAAATPALADEDAASQLRRLVDRLADRSRVTRPFLLRRFDATRLSARERVLYETLLAGADADAALAQRAWGRTGQPYPVTHRTGAWRSASSLRDGNRVRGAVRAVNRDTNDLRACADRGVIAPDFLIDAALREVRGAMRGVGATQVADGDMLIESLSRQADVLEHQRAHAGNQAGMWRLPDGDEFYAQTLQFQLGAPLDPHEAHARAAERCSELQAQADPLLRAEGLTRGSVAARLRAFARDERFQLRDRPAAVAAMNAQLSRTRELAAPVLDITTQGVVAELDPALSAGGARSQRNGANLLMDFATTRPAWSLASMVHHEHTPGHILQARFNRGVPPLQLRYSGGFGEAWSIYAEMLADELGAFEGNRPARIGYLQWMMFRMARVVADTGIHAKRWSRERAIAEMYALQGDETALVTIEDDVARFAAQPGAFAVQGYAALHFMDLRERTRRAAGTRFSLSAFHDAALRGGPLSPPGLEQAMKAAFDL